MLHFRTSNFDKYIVILSNYRVIIKIETEYPTLADVGGMSRICLGIIHQIIFVKILR